MRDVLSRLWRYRQPDLRCAVAPFGAKTIPTVCCLLGRGHDREWPVLETA